MAVVDVIFPWSISGVKCPDGWTQGDGSCYFLSTDLISLVTEAVDFCENLGSTLVEVSQFFLL